MYVFSHSFPISTKLPLIATEEDTGPFTKALVEDSPGKNLIAYRSWMTMDEYLEIIVKALGVKARNLRLPAGEGMAGLPEDLVQEILDNGNYFAEFGYEGKDDPSLVHPKDVSPKTVQKAYRSLTLTAER